ncbi:hypothetical protein ACFO1V_12365 [Daeguia caeni]|uniref:Uncharacterized protein n=1 Tax=Daeguia caeni TaxID=439612 RepID=A0ABV9H6Y1_9HYPH
MAGHSRDKLVAGGRIRAAATFESVFQIGTVCTDIPDYVFAPKLDPKQLDMPMHDLTGSF